VLRAVVLALTPPKGTSGGGGTGGGSLAAAAELLLERELKFDCDDCCNVARTSLELIRSRENSNAANSTDTEADQTVRVS
jgi:hypothetical protein